MWNSDVLLRTPLTGPFAEELAEELPCDQGVVILFCFI